jgi:hypothetical protein
MPVSLADRLAGAVVGAAVADAACQPLHWNYDVEALDAKLAREDRAAIPEFFPQTAKGNPYYSLPTGKQTCYGDQSHVLLRSIVACGGELDAQHFADAVAAFFSYDAEGSDYPPFGHTPPPKGEQLVGGWRHASVKGLLQNVGEGRVAFDVCGSDDEQVDSVAKVAPLVAAGATPAQVARAVRVVQNTDVAADNALAAARTLELVVGGATITDALAQCIEEQRGSAVGSALAAAVAKAGAPHRQVVGEIGRA